MYLVRISKMGDIFDQKYYPIRTFAHCTYPVRMLVCVHIVSICKYLHASKSVKLAIPGKTTTHVFNDIILKRF